MKQVFCSANIPSIIVGVYANPVNISVWGTTEASVQVPWPIAGTFRNMRAEFTGSVTETVTFRKNGSATSLAASVSGGTVATDSSNDVTVAAGDLIAIVLTTGENLKFFSIEFESETDNGSAYANVTAAPTSATTFDGLFRAGPNSFTGTDDLIDRNMVPIGGSVTSVYMRLTAAPGSGKSWTFSICIDGTEQDGSGGTVDTRRTISDAETSANWSFTLPLTAGETVCIKSVPSGSPASANANWGVSFAASENGYSIFCGRNNSTLNTSVTTYGQPNDIVNRSWATTEADNENAAGLTEFQLRGLIMALSNQPGSGGDAWTFTGRVNAATPSGSPSVTLTDAETEASDDGSMTVSPGDTFSLQCVPTGTPGTAQTVWAFGQFIADPGLRVTQLIALLVQDRDPDPATTDDPTGNGDVGAGTDPGAGLDLCNQPVPVAYIELTPPGSSTTYRYSKAPINRSVQDDPRVESFGIIRRALTSRQGDLRGSSMDFVLIDTDRVLRGLEDSDSLVNSVVRAYLTTLAGLDAGSTPRRVFSGLVTETESLGGLRMRIHAADYWQLLLEKDGAA